MTNHRGSTIAEDLYQKQEQVIKELRNNNAELEALYSNAKQTNLDLLDKIDYLQNEVNESRIFRSAFRNGNVTYNEAMQSVLTVRNNQIQADHTRINQEREAQRQEVEREAKQQLMTQIKQENPKLFEYYEKVNQDIVNKRDALLKAAEYFYALDDSQIAVYTAKQHKPEQSAVKYLLETYVNDSDFTIFRCLHCEREFTSLGNSVIGSQDLTRVENRKNTEMLYSD